MRRPRRLEPENARRQLIRLLEEFEANLLSGDLRMRVKALVPAFRLLSDLGSSLIPQEKASSARERILRYFLKYPGVVISAEELMVVSGISEWGRRIRELRVQFGWKIASGVTMREMSSAEELEEEEFPQMRPDQYMLLDSREDREAARRWKVANEIRKSGGSVQKKVLNYLRSNVGEEVSGEELRYVAGDRTEWARRVRELRTEFGWPISTRNSGRPRLPVGVYLLEMDRQGPKHDRVISEPVRRAVLRRDGHRCLDCGWHPDEWNRADPRHLELHHVYAHVEGGENLPENLITLCHVCHDERHAKDKEAS